MIFFLKKQKAKSKKQKAYRLNKGMTYVELIVVLSIFAIMSSVVIFNYGKFQAKVDIKVLANDIALKIVQAQKDAMSGKIPVQAIPPNWKPSYGIYFNKTTNPTSFIYFVDYNSQNNIYDIGEDLEGTTNIHKGINIYEINFNGDLANTITGDLDITFTRPNSAPRVFVNNIEVPGYNFNYIQITIISPQGHRAYIQLYSSGRIQIN